MAKTIVVKQIGSPIRRPAKQRQTLIGLGLNKMHKTRELELRKKVSEGGRPPGFRTPGKPGVNRVKSRNCRRQKCLFHFFFSPFLGKFKPFN